MGSLFKAISALILSLSLLSCQETKTDGLSGRGSLRILATDAPVDFETIASIKVTVSEVMVRSVAGELMVLVSEEVTLDLLLLRNGLAEILADVGLPTGKYDEIRLKISAATVDLKDGRHFDLKIPSSASSGLKLLVSPAFVISPQERTDILLDFDLARSLISLGARDDLSSFLFKPVIRSSLLSNSGTISGEVTGLTDEKGVPGATVTVRQGATVITTAVADGDGFFKILGVPTGVYDLTAEAASFGSLTIDAVPVKAREEVTTHFILTPVSGP